MAALSGSRPDCVVIDEAHCISQRGHDFRPEYRSLGRLKELFDIPMAAFTATATPRVQKDIVSNLKLRQPLVRVHRFYRPNLSFAAVMEGSERRRAERVLRQTEIKGASIVYCSSRKRVDELAADLRRAGRPAFAYHAGLDGPRSVPRLTAIFATTREWSLLPPTLLEWVWTGRMCAALSMPRLPGTAEAYYQEAGRAGRDGIPAICLLFHSPGDSRHP